MLDPDEDDTFFAIINNGIDAHVVQEGKNFLVAELMPGVYDIVTDGTLEASQGARDFLIKTHGVGSMFWVWYTTKLENGKYCTTVALDEQKK